MKLKTLTGILLTVFSVLLLSCASHSATVSTRKANTRKVRTTTSTRALPPGQAKKVNGDKSARAYAPGHNKN